MSTTRRSLSEGIGLGIVAGVIFAIAEVIAAMAMGMSAIAPFRMFASIVWGPGAMASESLGAVVLLGVIVHLALSAAFGAIYGLLDSGLPERTQRNSGKQAVLGLAFGAVLYLVNFQIIARIAYPWFLEAGQGLQLALHAITYGLPLGLMYAAAERRVTTRPLVHGRVGAM